MTVTTPDNVPDMFREAFRVAKSGRPGPVFIEVPSNFWRIHIEYQPLQPNTYKNLHPTYPDKASVALISKAFFKAKNPVIVIGEGAAVDPHIKQTLSRFIKQSGVPFTVSPLAKDLVNERDPLCIGALRSTWGERLTYQHLKQVDFVLSLGNRFEQWEWDWAGNKTNVLPQATIAQVDYDADEIGRVYPADYSVVSNISSFIEMFPVKKHASAASQSKKLKVLQARSKEEVKDLNGIHPVNLVTISQEVLPENACIVSDTGNIGSQIITRFKTSLTQRFLHAQRNSPMEYGVPASLGAALTHRGPVVCFVGDGSFNMTGNELGLLLNYDLKVIIVIANDKSCSMIKDGNQAEFKRTMMTEFNNPNYATLAEAYGIVGKKVSNSQEFKSALKFALQSKKSVIIDAQVAYPPDAWIE